MKDLSTVHSLELHVYISHFFIDKKAPIQCKELNCYRDLNGWVGYRRHLLKHHKFRLFDDFEDNAEVIDRSNNENKNKNQVETSDSTDEFQTSDVCDRSENDDNYNNSVIYKERMHKGLISFVGKLYAASNLPRSHVQEIIDDVTELLGDFTSYIRFVMKDILKTSETHEIENLLHVLTAWDASLNELSTETRRLKMLERTGCLIYPKAYTIGAICGEKRVQNRIVKEMISLKAQYIPIKEVLTAFFNLPGVLDCTLKYMNQINNEMKHGLWSNFIQGELWQEKIKKHFKGKIVLPLFIYYDDIEINNPLGTHAVLQKLGAVYFTIPCLPPEFRSTLDNIFLSLIFHASDRSNFSNASIFHVLVDQISDIQREGITVEVGETKHVIYFAMGLFLGDNLGLNTALGFTGSFNANYFCRFCKAHKTQTCSDLTERKDMLRTENEYMSDVDMGVESTGLNENSIWNVIPYFHVVFNFVADVMHDLLEGVLKYDMAHILHHYIIETKTLSLDILNDRLRTFDYQLNNISNKPPLISKKEIEKKCLKMSASEMYNFTFMFCMLVGDLVPHDEVWEFVIILKKILDLVSAKIIQKEYASSLEFLVAEHHSMYLRLFKDRLKPKHHFMVHYGTIMRMSGPLGLLSSMRYESKNRMLKLCATATSSRRNITYTIALKQQLNLCFRLLDRKGFYQRLTFGPISCIDNLASFIDLSKLINSVPLGLTDGCAEVSWVEWKGIKYKVNFCVALNSDELDVPLFGIIELILINEKKEVYFICKILLIVQFDEMLNAYEIEETSYFKCEVIDNLASPWPCMLVKFSDGRTLVTPKYIL